MASPRTLARLDVLLWALILGGLAMLSLGIATHAAAATAGWSLAVMGAVATAAGVVLIFVRARLTDAAASAQSDPHETERKS